MVDKQGMGDIDNQSIDLKQFQNLIKRFGDFISQKQNIDLYADYPPGKKWVGDEVCGIALGMYQLAKTGYDSLMVNNQIPDGFIFGLCGLGIVYQMFEQVLSNPERTKRFLSDVTPNQVESIKNVWQSHDVLMFLAGIGFQFTWADQVWKKYYQGIQEDDNG